MSGFVSVTAYRAFGQLQILGVEHQTTETGRSYRLLFNETVPLPDVEREDPADDLALIAVALWRAADRLAGVPF